MPGNSIASTMDECSRQAATLNMDTTQSMLCAKECSPCPIQTCIDKQDIPRSPNSASPGSSYSDSAYQITPFCTMAKQERKMKDLLTCFNTDDQEGGG